ncbi:MAG: HEPN domain-containing protein [Acidobacteriota bacterium]|nr:MAG: HEPN domain-containing protein [Acidobacteriota bacterium]
MKQITSEWIEKAEGDWFAAQQLYRVRKNQNYDAVCFHAQQCAEKYLKARLEEANIDFGRTHNLLILLTLAIKIEPLWAILQPNLNALNIYSVEFRYPGNSAVKADARDAIKQCREVRRLIRTAFNLPL